MKDVQDCPGENHSKEDDSSASPRRHCSVGRAVQGRKGTSVSQEDLSQPVLQDATPSGCMELAWRGAASG